MDACRVGIVGVDRFTALLVELLCPPNADRFKLAAICDGRGDVLRRYEIDGRTWQLYDDPREMILRSGIQMLVTWSGEGLEDTLEVAIDKGVWVVMRSPAKLTAGFAGRVLRRAHKQGVGAFVWCPWMFVPSFESANEWLFGQQVRSMFARFDASDETLDRPSLDDPLIAVAYPIAFLAQNWLGLPERVFCHQQVHAPGDSNMPIQYHCSLNLIYSQAVVSIAGALNSGPDRWEVTLHGSNGTIELAMPQANWYDARGNLRASSENYTTDQVKRIGYERNLSAVWQVYQQRQRSAAFELKRHIATTAILEAAALSARTGGAEQLVKVAELSEIVSLD